jgi:predicted Holliday junction resolvase-like endonuclease
MTQKLVQQLYAIKGLEVECPHCSEQFPIKHGKLFNMYDSYPPAIQKILRARLESANESKTEFKERRKQLAADKKLKPAKITVSAKASNFGQIAEQILPAFRTFPYSQSECRIMFKPIDYIVFANLAANGKVENIKFVDVKTGDGRLDYRQRQIRDRIHEGKIKHKVLK